MKISPLIILLFALPELLPYILSSIGRGLFIINIIILISVLIIRKLKNTRKYKLLFILPIIGIFFGFILMLSSHSIISYREDNPLPGNRNAVNKDTMICWETEDDNLFYYNDREYQKFFIDNNFNAKTDKRLTHIYHKNESIIDAAIFSVKNCTDLSLLSTSQFSTYKGKGLYCDTDLIEEKEKYYKNRDNYNYFIARDDYFDNDDLSKYNPLSRNDFDILENIKYDYNDNWFILSYKETVPVREFERIFIVGKSLDGVGTKLFKEFIVDNDKIYFELIYSRDGRKVVELEEEYQKLILSLLK